MTTHLAAAPHNSSTSSNNPTLIYISQKPRILPSIERGELVEVHSNKNTILGSTPKQGPGFNSGWREYGSACKNPGERSHKKNLEEGFSKASREKRLPVFCFFFLLFQTG
jgi:hypothetical protein